MLPCQVRVDLGAMAMKGSSTFPKPQHHWKLTIRLSSVISRILIGGLTSLQRCSWCILQPQPTGQMKGEGMAIVTKGRYIHQILWYDYYSRIKPLKPTICQRYMDGSFIFWFQWKDVRFRKSFQADSWSVLSISEVFPVGW